MQILVSWKRMFLALLENVVDGIVMEWKKFLSVVSSWAEIVFHAWQMQFNATRDKADITMQWSCLREIWWNYLVKKLSLAVDFLYQSLIFYSI